MKYGKIISVVLLLILYERLEYLWYLFADIERYYSTPFYVLKNPIRLDGWVYLVSVKVQHVIMAVVVHILLPFRRVTWFVIGAFFLAVPELFLTYNEPFFKIPLPFGWYLPGSTATLKCGSVIWLLVEVVRKWLRGYPH